MTRENIISAFFAALLLFILYSTLLILSPFLQPIFWSAIIAFGFYPVYLRILDRCGGHRPISSFLMTLLIFLIAAPILIFILASIIREAAGAYDWILGWIEAGGMDELMEKIHSIGWVQKAENSEILKTHAVREHLKNALLNFAQTFGSFTLKQSLLITKNTLMACIYFFLTIFLAFFFFRDGDRIYRFIYKITPLKEKIKKLVFAQLVDTFAAVLRGQIVTALVQALLAGIIYWVLGVPFPLFFASVTFLASLIPVLGAATVWVPLAAYLALIKEYPSAIILTVLGVLVISLVDNFLKPLLIGEKTKLPYLLLFLGILGGLQVYGLMGIFLAPVVLSLFFVLVKIYQEEILAE